MFHSSAAFNMSRYSNNAVDMGITYEPVPLPESKVANMYVSSHM